jgi:hypothetical protein
VFQLFRDDAEVVFPEPVSVVHTGRPGRPAKIIDPNFLREALSLGRKLSVARVAKELGVHRETVDKSLAAHNIIPAKFSTIPDAALDKFIGDYRRGNPGLGLSYLTGALRGKDLKVQMSRVFASIERVDGLGAALHRNQTIVRRVYQVSRPNFLWHVDGHHKLILWGFVIHGFIDGYDRTVSNSVVIHV